MKNLMLMSILLVLLTGCVGEDGESSYGRHYEYHDTYVDQYGLTMPPARGMYVTREEVTRYYEEMMTCTGLVVPGPTVEFRSFKEAFGWSGGWGFYVVPHKAIWINIDEFPGELNRSRTTDRAVLKHEFLHHILRSVGLYTDSENHSGPFWKQCTPPIVNHH